MCPTLTHMETKTSTITLEHPHLDSSIKLQLDWTPEGIKTLAELQSFFSGQDDRMERAQDALEGHKHEPAHLLLHCCAQLIFGMVMSNHEEYLWRNAAHVIAAKRLPEGYPPLDGSYGLTLLEWTPPEWDIDELEVTEFVA